MSLTNLDKFQNLDFAAFKELAKDETLSPHEKIGFPDSYRAGKETVIFDDIADKLSNLNKNGQVIIDIGAGCGALAFLLIELCLKNENTLVLIDSEEMLAHLPNDKGLIKIPAYYPNDCQEFLKEYKGCADAILIYSVLHYVFDEGNLYKFLDSTLELLAVGGQCLIGDVPNISKRKRFFSSPTGIKYHQDFMNTMDAPQVEFNRIEMGQIDDAVLISLMLRARQAGFDAYILPQTDNLPMANRREDIFIKRP
jgi:2-polyprenyl-3-methyl-5-hydroxy-6-metoxy-1,4-benzoquinol methylase